MTSLARCFLHARGRPRAGADRCACRSRLPRTRLQRPTTAVEVCLDGLALRFEAKARFALLFRRNPVVCLLGEPYRTLVGFDPPTYGPPSTVCARGEDRRVITN